MVLDNLSLPLDIPWNYLGASPDMMDKKLDNKFPPKWRSSVALYYYEPSEFPEELENRKITYLKVVCSFSGFQPDINWFNLFTFFSNNNSERFSKLKDHLKRVYPAYGALLQVSVFPSKASERKDLRNFPIIIDFEPKKRELYEIVTDTGQTVSSSKSVGNISKGLTSTMSTENSSTLSGTASYGKKDDAGIGIGGSLSSKSGVNIQDSTITNIDHSREKRESQSHTTNLSQLYTLLQSYHLGTNRALFQFTPRPHLVEEEDKRTFVDAPNALGGVQELLIVTSRPKTIDSICVKAFLETGHLDLEATNFPSYERTWEVSFEPPPRPKHGGGPGDDSTPVRERTTTKSFPPPYGYEIDEDRGDGGFLVMDSEGDGTFIVSSSKDGVSVTGTTYTQYIDNFGDNNETYERKIKVTLKIFLRRARSLRIDEIRNTFFITARSLTACLKTGIIEDPIAPVDTLDWVTGEDRVDVDPGLSSPDLGVAFRMRAANSLSLTIMNKMVEFQSSPDRYESKIPFEKTAFVAGLIEKAIGGKDSLKKPVKTFSLSSSIKKKIKSKIGTNATKFDVLRLSNVELKEILKLKKLEDALEIKRKLSGLKI